MSKSIIWLREYVDVSKKKNNNYIYIFNLYRYSYLEIQGVIEMHGIILTTSYWLHVELGNSYFCIKCAK
jgi:hypothetical protein